MPSGSALGARELGPNTPDESVRNACTGVPNRRSATTLLESPLKATACTHLRPRSRNMAHRADEQLEDTFNPRTLQTGVLVPVLDDAAPALATGQFPPASLLGKLGGYRALDAAARRDLRRLAGGEEGRLGALLELWDGSGHLVNLPGPCSTPLARPIPDAGEPRPTTDAAGPRRRQGGRPRRRPTHPGRERTRGVGQGRRPGQGARQASPPALRGHRRLHRLGRPRARAQPVLRHGRGATFPAPVDHLHPPGHEAA